MGPEDRVFPVFGVGKADYDKFIERLGVYANVETDGIYKFSGPTNLVHLQYKNEQDRVECSQNIAEPIPWKKIAPRLDTSMVLINMISGFDISLETLDSLRMEIREKHIPVYMDVHSLTLGMNSDFTRFHRPVEAWRRWLFWLHAAQMNEEEAAVVPPERFDEPTFAKQVLALNTKALVVTRGAKGYTAFIDEHKQTHRVDRPAFHDGPVADTTGCGDVFAASYCAHYVKSQNVLDAADFANRVAGTKIQQTGSSEIDKLSALRLRGSARKERVE